MTKANDVAAYIIHLAEQTGESVTNMKLQKLLYYSYAWYLVEKGLGNPLFSDEIQAWKYGPVVPVVYEEYKIKGADNIDVSLSGDIANLNSEQKKIVEEIFFSYGKKAAADLVDLTHSEVPWLTTYEDGVRDRAIPDELIYKFYSEKKQQFLSTQA